MARFNKSAYESYKKDVFDEPPVGPIGVHRGKKSLLSRIMPYIVVILVAVITGLGSWLYFSGEYANIHWPWQGSTTSEVSSSNDTGRGTALHSTSENGGEGSSSSGAETGSNSGSASNSGSGSSESDSSSSSSNDSSSSSQTTTTQAAANKNTAIRVVNGTSRAGYAATNAAKLQASGYTNVTAANPSGSTPSSSVVWYQSESDKATAQEVANILGISSVEQADGISSPVVAVLMQ
ncbi:MAG: LytR C-terminal domain-containing protein [Bifidobacteriaceae bacterium]|nr:LytR C-terminal domain-containing protein [Bifidobacteriaceae bacterium]